MLFFCSHRFVGHCRDGESQYDTEVAHRVWTWYRISLSAANLVGGIMKKELRMTSWRLCCVLGKSFW